MGKLGPRGPYKHHKHCKVCGASDTYWKKERNLVDLNSVEPIFCENISGYNPVDVFCCSHCKEAFTVTHLGDFEDESVYENPEFTEYEFIPRFCPYCGCKVIRKED